MNGRGVDSAAPHPHPKLKGKASVSEAEGYRFDSCWVHWAETEVLGYGVVTAGDGLKSRQSTHVVLRHWSSLEWTLDCRSRDRGFKSPHVALGIVPDAGFWTRL